MKNLRKLQQGSLVIPLLAACLVTTGLSYVGVKKYLGLGDHVGTFMWGCITKPSENGAFAPCSKYVAEEIIKPLRVCIEKKQQEKTADHPLRVFEIGAGNGIFTREIVHMLHESHLSYQFDVVEINNDYCKKLREEFSNYPSVSVHCMSILEWQKKEQYYDVIVSSVPFSIFSTQEVRAIFDLYRSIIKPNGYLSYIKLQGQKVMETLLMGDRKRRYQERQDIIAEFNDQYCYEKTYVTRNIPPLYVYHCRF